MTISKTRVLNKMSIDTEMKVTGPSRHRNTFNQQQKEKVAWAAAWMDRGDLRKTHLSSTCVLGWVRGKEFRTGQTVKRPILKGGF